MQRLIYATPGRDKRGDTTVLDIYLRLAKNLEDLIMGYPFNEALTDLLKAMYSPVEAEVALAIPENRKKGFKRFSIKPFK